MKKKSKRDTIKKDKGEMKKMRIVVKIIAIFIMAILLIYSCADIVQANQQGEIVLVLDPGHGGKMTGAVNNKLGIIERDATLKIARYLRDYLKEYEGIRVIMTHDGLPSDYEMELAPRGMVARNNKANMLISLHLNDYSTPYEHGAEVYVTANTLLPKYHEESAKFGEMVLEELSKLGIAKRKVKTRLCGDTGPKWEYSDGTVADYYGVIRYPMKGDGEDRGVDLAKGEGIPGVIIEHCFINDSDERFIDSEEDLKNLARADCNAIVKYYKLDKKDPKRVSSITLNKQKMMLIVGRKETLQAVVKPDTAVNKKVIWSSSNPEIATVSTNGELTARKEGIVTITAKTEDRGKEASCTVTVQEIKVTFPKTETNLLEGKKVQLQPDITPEEIANQPLTWKSSDETVATVSKNGLITALKEGTTTITASLEKENKQATIKVNVHKLKEGQNIESNSLREANGILSKIGEKVSVKEFKDKWKNSNNLELIVKDKNGNALKDENYITTNTQIEIRTIQESKVIQEYTCLIYGDVNGDGKISALDYAYIKNHIMDIQKITKEIEKKAANINEDEKISALDYAYIKNHIMDIQKIELK